MRCTRPRTVGFKADGKTISWSQRHYSKEFATFELPCGKCLHCRLEYARQWAIRCMHEARVHPENSFVTLTYNDENLPKGPDGRPRLHYQDFQLFMKRLRQKRYKDFVKTYGPENWKLLSKQERRQIYGPQEIGFFVTGEYGDQTKRPHWHAIIFNYRPHDAKPKYRNKRGDQVFSSESLDGLWGKGNTDFGSVTFDSAGYCARYATKKLNHGKDGDHDYHPISKKSSRQAIGKKFLQKYWRDIFTYGHIILEDGKRICSIPRYYEKWLLKYHPEEWLRYTENIKLERSKLASEKALLEQQKHNLVNLARGYKGGAITRQQMEDKSLKAKIKHLNDYRKGND